MKKIFYVLSLVLVMSSMISCQNVTEKSDNKTIFEFEDLSYDNIYRYKELDKDDFMSGDGTHKESATLVLPLKINNIEIKELRDSLLSLANARITNDGKLEPISVGEDTEMELTSGDSKTGDPSTYETSDLSINLINSRLIVWGYSFANYMGGAHGFYGSRFLNFSIKLAKILSLDDLFVTGFEDPLNNLIRNVVKMEYEDEVYNPDEIDDIEFTRNFRLTNYGIEFIYDPYEIGPYSSGEIRVSLTLDELYTAGLIKPEIKEKVFGV